MENFHCTYCQNLILGCRIQCVECRDFDLCLQCFACGVEAAEHTKDHDYRVVDDGNFSVFRTSEPWTVIEDEKLLDAVEQYGFGNWEDVAKYVDTKSTEECRDHYSTFFIHGNIGKATLPTEFVKKIKDHTGPEDGPLSPSLTKPLPPVELSIQEQQELGYMPLRDDFEREYDNEAEVLVSSLSLNYDDDDLDTAFKLAQVDMYRQRLKERQRRKRIALQYGIIQNGTILGSKKTPTNKKKLTREEKEFQEKMRVFAQFHSAAEHEQLFENLQKEKKIKSRIKELGRYRKNGITKLDECTVFDQERVKRDKRREIKKKMGSSLKRTASMVLKKEKSEDENGDIIIADTDIKTILPDLASLPSYELLSEREKRLCHSICMKPANYITIKTYIIKDCLQRPQGVPMKIRYPTHLDKTHRRKILSFLNESGWIGAM